MLIAIRSALFYFLLPTITLVLSLIALPALFMGRDRVRSMVQFWARTVLRVLKLVTGMDYRLEGAENIPQSGALVASNHQSMWETIALYAVLPRPVVILKKELTHVPVYGWWIKPAGSIAIDRKGGAKSLRVMREAAKDAIDRGDQVVVFPEGTRLKPGHTARFQPGAAAIYKIADAPCVPVAHDSGRFWQHPEGLKHPGTVTLRFLPAIASQKTRQLDSKAFTTELKNRIDHGRPDIQTDAPAHGIVSQNDMNVMQMENSGV